MNIPTTHNTELIERFLQHITASPVPPLVSTEYLRENGFVSSNDGELRDVFRLLGFIDEESKPSARWAQYKERGKEVLQIGVEECYAGLLALYSSPYNRSDEDLHVWFRPPNTTASKTNIERAIRTFKKLFELAGLAPPSKPLMPLGALRQTKSERSAELLSINQPKFVLQLPVLAGRAQYVELLEAIKEVFM